MRALVDEVNSIDHQMTLPIGLRARIDSAAQRFEIGEAATTEG